MTTAGRKKLVRTAAISLLFVGGIGASSAFAQVCESIFNRLEDVRSMQSMEDFGQEAASAEDAMTRVSPDVVQADLMMPGWYEGIEALYKNLVGQWSKVSLINHAYNHIDITSTHDMGCLAAEVIATDFTPDREHKLDITYRIFDVGTRTRGGTWVMRLDHAYWPIDRHTGQYLMDLPAQDPGKPVAWPKNIPSGPAVSETQAKAEVTQWLKSRVAASTADQVLGHFVSGDAMLAYGPYLPGIYKGRAQVRAYYADMLRDVRSINATITDSRIVTDGVMAAVLSRQNLVLTKSDGSTERQSIRHSACMRREGNKWYAMMEAISFPVDLKTKKVVTDLTAAR